MTDDFRTYLATEILSEQRTLSYRNVSRALRVHVNAAKCMLYDFYQFQNEKKPCSVYATYLLSGLKKQQRTIENDTNGATDKHQYNEDEPIPSSPPPFTSSMLEPSQQSNAEQDEHEQQVSVGTITLIREEDLEAMKEQYETITSIHIYSLSPARIQDLVTLTDINRGLFQETFTKEDPLLNNKTYGIIQNQYVRRRKGKKPVVPKGPPPKFQAVKEDPKPSSNKPDPKPAVAAATAAKKDDHQSRPSSRDSTSTAASGQKPAPLKRDASDLFKAFAKQSQQKPKAKAKPTPTATATPPQTKDPDTPMFDDDEEGESDDEALFLHTGTRKPATTKKRPSDVKQEREDKAAKVRKLFGSDDEEEEAEPAAVPKVEKAAGLEAEPVIAQKGTDVNDDDDEVAWSDSDTERKKKNDSGANDFDRTGAGAGAEAGHNVTSGPRRRRGKRKVMKKRTTKDEDGYLVTKEEAVWESFSEEEEPEPMPAAKKPMPTPTPRSSLPTGSGKSQSQKGAGAGAGGKPGPKKGGTIMSFFGKKT
ncbi:CDC27 protein [Exophiala dermatitidis]|nr:CDC27 protein [Exophiala dermatitidis]KAJ4514911.1 CDC27 protein [Exophiala dermatitidis]KAJ4517403.1 CDC27 protein [Exophiala dermatitidis]KAJ4548846.1 CDC27 protein [Exophiala dermatitidis]KAJ4550629.1 CDC27 protein [Exophiala dermatitidis]